MTEQDITIICPNCDVTLRLKLIGAVLNPKQTEMERKIRQIIHEQPVVLDVYEDHYTVTPTEFMGDSWKQIHNHLKPFGARWVSDKTDKTKSHWRIPKPNDSLT
jgi:hypothetical protein